MKFILKPAFAQNRKQHVKELCKFFEVFYALFFILTVIFLKK